MNELTKRAVAETLENAIIRAANHEMSHIWDDWVAANNGIAVENALGSLRSLQRGGIPRYDDRWVALLYSSWYQPSHINMAYSMIAAMTQIGFTNGATLTNSGDLHVVDFGCGALAMQFGVCLAVADSLEQGQTIRKVRVDSIDTSQSMIDVGLKIWKEFKNLIEQDERTHLLCYVRQAIQLMDIQTCTSYEEIRKQAKADRWMSSLHTVYPANFIGVKKALSSIYKTVTPLAGFITSHEANAIRAKLTSPFTDSEYHKLETSSIAYQIVGYLPKLTQWRNTLKQIVLQPSADAKIGDPDFVSRYLSNSVAWGWSNRLGDTKFLIYAKR